ncbi:putative surface protein SACOL0050 [Telopea speciosissima]|uniref:putative surface protein SACOL0050 n=1 Tax=Telopea speciosissima TaxID=54955 RepID=UPI001CC5D21A|nr:putative surface protein SACOL0050 [Telopea speciosissima]
MGGCATKPKTLKGDEDLAPAPEPAPVKEVSEAKEVAVDGEEAKLISHEEGAEIQGEEKKVTDKPEVGDGEGDDVVKVDDTANKPRSLSNLFKEGEEDKESSVNDETTQKEEPKTETITKEESSSFPEAEQTATTPVAEVKSTLPVVPASETVEKEKTVIAAATDVQQGKTENEEEKGVVAKDV